MKVLVTGSAGFIGFHVAARFLEDGHDVLGYDGLTPYYDVALKKSRQALLERHQRFTPVNAMLEDRTALAEAVRVYAPDLIIHLAAQAGVRYSLDHPQAYVDSNVVGTFNLLEAARATPPQHFLFASTSSVYGGNEKIPFGETDRSDHPMSLYAATKKAGEAMSHSYAHLFGFPVTCFRFFTVYGPWGRPDMAPFKFVSAIRRGDPIDVYGHGRMRRDFTYIDDLVEAIMRLTRAIPERQKPVTVAGGADSLSPVAPWRTVNIAGGQPVGLMDFIAMFEAATGTKAKKNLLPVQPGDVVDTDADPALLKALTGFVPAFDTADGVRRFVQWYDDYYAETAD